MTTDPRRAPPSAALRRAADLAAAWGRRATSRPRLPHRIVVTSLPKAGTNLVRKALAAIPGTVELRTGLFGATAPAARPGRPTLPIGVDWPVAADAAAVARRLRAVPPGGVLLTHAPYSPALAAAADDVGARVLAVIRDPRDVAASLVPFVLDRPHHFLHARFAALAPAARLTASLAGLPPDADGSGLRDAATRCRSVTDWAGHDGALVVRFEDLIGPSGGGTVEAQADTVATIARTIGAPLDPDAAATIGAGLFGGTATFRKGQVGGWRDDFGPEHVALSSDLLGGLLADLGYPPHDEPHDEPQD